MIPVLFRGSWQEIQTNRKVLPTDERENLAPLLAVARLQVPVPLGTKGYSNYEQATSTIG